MPTAEAEAEETFWDLMKEETRQVLHRSLSLIFMQLIASWSSANSDLEPTLMNLEKRIAAIEVSQNALKVKVQQRRAELKSNRNQFSALHLLPAELFSTILLNSISTCSWTLQDTQTLAGVCKIWRDVVLSSPLFFRAIDAQDSKSTTELVLERNQTALLQVRCSAMDLKESTKKPFIKMAAPHAERWRALSFRGDLTKTVKYMEVPTPNLVDLFLIHNRRLSEVETSFDLLDGPPLRNVEVEFVSLPWLSCRLTRLRSLQLRRLSITTPSNTQLHTILGSSPELWYLRLSDLRTLDSEESEAAIEATPIHLPKLSCIALEKIPPSMADFLLTSIDTTTCRTVWVDGIHSKHFTNPLFTQLVLPSIQNAPYLKLTYNVTEAKLTVRTSPRLHFTSGALHEVTESPGFHFEFQRETLHECRHALIEFMARSDMMGAFSRL